MENIYAMLARIDFLDEVMENERKKAAKVLQDEMRTFVAHYENEKEVEVENLTLEEMEILHEYIVERINNDLQYLEDEIERYQDLY